MIAAVIVLYAELAGSVNPGSAAHLIDAIHTAEEQGAEALVVRLDTPGGLLSSTRDVVQAELSARVPIVFWVGPPGARAGSAGVFLTLAAHVAAMAPSSNIGAAHPVDLFGSNKPAPKDEPDVMAKKMENDTIAFARGIAERRSRNIDWAEKAVRDSESITASKAVELHVVDLLAEDVPDLLRKLDGRHVDLGNGDKRILHTAGAEVRNVGWRVKDRVLHELGDPEVVFLIGALGVIGILLELFHPGTIVPGVVGGICVLIAAIGLQMLSVHIGALALVLLGVGFFAAEFYAGGHGGFIAAGAVCVVIGSLLLIGHVDSKFYADSDFGLGWKFVTPIGLAMAAIAGSLAWKISRSTHKPLTTGAFSLVGELGTVREPTGPEGGSVQVSGELWKALSAVPIAAGETVRVLSVRGLTLDVAPESALTKANP
ncbi:MAG TPA: nodulation protein NfeD [Myxococcales bacterium]|nr:nodulation protein NfeD [Myxococcales bacterium]